MDWEECFRGLKKAMRNIQHIYIPFSKKLARFNQRESIFNIPQSNCTAVQGLHPVPITWYIIASSSDVGWVQLNPS
jgi:hypothetical protein